MPAKSKSSKAQPPAVSQPHAEFRRPSTDLLNEAPPRSDFDEQELKNLLQRVAERQVALEEVGLAEEQYGAGFDVSTLANPQCNPK